MTENKFANPAPLGLMGFGMTTVLLNIHNAGFFPLSAMVLAMGIFYGGLAQIIAGMNNPSGAKTPEAYMGWYLFLWGLFTFFMWFGTFGKNRVLQLVFLSLTVLFGLLAARDWTGSTLVGRIAGYEGIVCGLSAIYLAMAEVLNEAKGRIVLPIGQKG